MSSSKIQPRYSVLRDYLKINREKIKSRPFSEIDCVLDPELAYGSMDEKIGVVPCSSGLPLGITETTIHDLPPFDLPAVYQEIDTNKIVPENDSSAFATYFVGGNKANRGPKAWEEVSQAYCRSRNKTYDGASDRCQ